VIPVVPSQFDAWGLEKTLSLFNEALDFNQKARALIVLNRVPFLIGWQKRELREMMEFLKEVVADYENVSVARNFLVERVEYKKSIAEGLSVHEVRGKAMEEFAKFFDEVRKSVA
jgi:cellulose biosynthesis protein BcsQ